MTISPEKLPDPWFYDSAQLLRDLDIVREKILEIPLHPDTYTLANIALLTVWNMREKLQYLIGLHAAMATRLGEEARNAARTCAGPRSAGQR